MKKSILSFLPFYVLILLIAVTSVYAQPEPDKQTTTVKIYLGKDKVYAGEEVKAAVKLNIENGWHINSNKPNEDFLVPTQILIDTALGFKIDKFNFPQAKNLNLSFSDKPLSVYEGEVSVGAVITVPSSIKPGEYKVVAKIDYQSCNNATCLAPVTTTDTITFIIVEKSEATNQINQEIINKANSSDAGIKEESGGSVDSALEKSGLFLGLIIVFLGGLALNLTPCVYPLIPITVGYFGGQSEGNTKKLVLMSTLYVLGMSVMYSIIGVVTALSGAVFGALLQNTIVLIIIGAVLVTLSLSMFGVYEFKLPDALVAKAGGAKAGVWGSFFMGLTMGVVAAPCIGPFVLGLVTYVAAKANPFLGFIMFFVLSLGLGLPYFLLGIFSGKIKKLPRAGEWMDGIKHIFGFLLLGMAAYFVTPVLPKEIGKFFLPVFIVIAAIYLLVIDKVGNKVRWFRIFKSVFAIILILISTYMLIPSDKKSIEWKPFSEAAFNNAKASSTPVIIDFYADWCIPCKELDAATFSDDKVITESKRFISLKADLTKNATPEVEALKNKFNVKGVPTVLIIDSQGNEVKRITGFVPAEEFLKNLQEAK